MLQHILTLPLIPTLTLTLYNWGISNLRLQGTLEESMLQHS